ncbi:SLA class II histocompatibility antigen, DQ haplotype D beta chain-like [Scyliorhinus torazame]|uniref:SLA class II histocompatibility antigen, DQ haplotype D beta chain-like n=1 Tax=Scyliorhinus torazame TaxID=75743 RepID=UPI003B5A469F
MSMHDVCILLWITSILFTAGIRAQFQVTQAPVSTSVLLGSNVTFVCTFPIFQDNLDAEVYWWKLGELKFLQRDSDSRKNIVIFKRGGASFHLLNISARESGVYYCGVKTLEHRFVNGTGTTIKVFVPPTPLCILSKRRELNSSGLDLLCKTSAFYPEELKLTWYKNGIEVMNHTWTTIKLSSGGLYDGSSLLKETQSVRSGDVFTCQVSHATLPIPANVSFIAPISNQGDEKSFDYPTLCGSTAVAILFLLLIAIIGRHCNRIKNGACRYVENTEHHEKQTEQVTSDNKLTYVSLDLSGSRKTGELKNNDINTEYAQLRTTAQSRGRNINYTDVTF